MAFKTFPYQNFFRTVNSLILVSLLVVEQKPVNVNWQTLFCVIPYVWIWAFYRIEKLRMGILIAVGAGLASGAWSVIMPFPYGLLGNLVISIVFPIYFIRQWSREWNERVSRTA